MLRSVQGAQLTDDFRSGAAAENGRHSLAAVPRLRGPSFGHLLGALRYGFCHTLSALHGIADRAKWVDSQHADEWCLEYQRSCGRVGASSRPTHLKRHDCPNAFGLSGANEAVVGKKAKFRRSGRRIKLASHYPPLSVSSDAASPSSLAASVTAAGRGSRRRSR
jgi:hypothetical protein